MKQRDVKKNMTNRSRISMKKKKPQLHEVTVKNLKVMHRKKFNAERGHLTTESDKKGGNEEVILEHSSGTKLHKTRYY